MPVPTGGRSEYEKTLSSELQKLHAVFLEQHQKDVEMKVKKAAAKALRGLSREAATSGSTAEERPPKTLEEIDNSVHEADFDESLTCQKWLEFSEKLLELESSSVTQVDEPIVEEDLQMRASWKISWQEASTIHRNRNFLPSTRSKSYSLRMNEVIRDYTCIGRMVLPPRSKQQMVWTFFGTMLILWDLITIPLEFFALGPYTTDVLGVMGRLSMAFWMIDMPMNLFFGIEKQGRTEMRVIELARAYLRSYFVLDVLVVSIDIALLLVEILGEDADGGFRSARFLRTMRLLRLLRLLRAVKLQQELTLLANRFLSVHVFMVAKVVLGLIMMLLINHIIACLWYGVGSWTLMETGQSWISLSALAEDQGNTKAGFFESYAASMHWTLTQFTPATNNIAPDNAFERLFAVWVILLAMGVFSSFISSITATVSSLRASQAKQFHERAALLRFFCERNLSADLFGKVNEVLRKEGMFQVRIQEQEVGLIKGIPETLLQQLHEEMYMSLMAHLPFWPEWAYGEDMHFLRIVCHFAMKEHIAKPMQDAFLPGRCSPEALIIETGHMCYIPAGSTRDIVVGEGDILCLASLWAEWQYHGRLTASYGSANYVGINSVTFCQLATEHGGPLWQYLQIFGILLLGLLESSGNAITDLIYKSSLMELGPRAEKYAAVFNARNARTKGFSRSQSGSKESITWSKNMVQTLETFEKFGSQSLGA